MLVVVFTFLFIDMFDTEGTLVGVCTKAGLVNEGGTVKRIKEAFTIACCFAISLFFSPLFLSILSAAIAPVLILVGLMMLEPVRRIPFEDFTEALPAFIFI